jgi:hypothetical protein
MRTRYIRQFLTMTVLTVMHPALSVRAEPVSQESTVFRSDTRLVVLHATVVDKNGHFVTNLP